MIYFILIGKWIKELLNYPKKRIWNNWNSIPSKSRSSELIKNEDDTLLFFYKLELKHLYPPFSYKTIIFLFNSQGVRQWSRRPTFNPRSNHTKDSKNGTWCDLVSPQHNKLRLNDKVEQSREGLVPFHTPRWSSYWKRSLRVTLD